MHRQQPQSAWSRSAAWIAQAACVAALCLAASLAVGQSTLGQARPGMPQPGRSLGDEEDSAQAGNMPDEKLLRAQNASRQRSMVADTNKLLRLINEFNAEIARTGPADLNAEQQRKLAEIEKLARNVREKMATSVRGIPSFDAPFQPAHNQPFQIQNGNNSGQTTAIQK